ncbi:MAG: hypothetical protein Q8M20_09915 [Rhodocyclaceae bacterium]|nr:hypothetical protein [Rhodocyclaceae bacterium]MDZ4213557.1 hypothetical protein [Rhodocyclaceae bacterium]
MPIKELPANPDEVAEIVYEGRIDGVFKGFRNHDTLFKLQGGSTWRQFEYYFEYRHLFSPKITIYKIRNKSNGKEIFFMAVDGVKTMVEVKSSYA